MPENSCLVEHSPMTDMVASPAFQEFIDLEKNAKYYMMLLRIRETELERFTKAYEDLQVTLKCCLSTNSKLKDRIELLEQMLCHGDENKRKDTESYRKQVAGLTRNLVEVKRDNDVRTHELENDFKRRILEIEKMYTDKLNSKEIEFDRKMDELNIKLQRETVLNSKLKTDLETMMNVNVNLKNKIHLLRSRNSSEKASLEMELNEARGVNRDINAEALCLRGELERVADENVKFKQVIAEYQSKLHEATSRLNEFSRLNKTYKRLNSKLNNDLSCYKQKNKEINDRLDSLLAEEGRLKEEIERLKVIGNARSSHVRCDVPEHGNYDHVTRQNAVLQEIVKTMRRERNNKENEELRQAEDRIDKLQDAIDEFKRSGLFKTVSMHAIASHDGDK